MEGWLFFLGFIFVCGIIWGIVKGQEDKERAQERGLTFDERINNMNISDRAKRNILGETLERVLGGAE